MSRQLGVVFFILGLTLWLARNEKSPVVLRAMGQALGTTPEFWMALQSIHDLARSRPAKVVEGLPTAAG